MYAVALESEQDDAAAILDDSQSDLIKTLTPEQADFLWATLVKLNPRLADL